MARPSEGQGGAADDCPEPPPVIVSQSTGLLRRGRIIVDRARGEVVFERCHTPRVFFARTERQRTCPTSEILDVIESRVRGGISMTVVTARGKAVVPGTATHFHELRDALRAMIPGNPHGPETDHPNLTFVVSFGAMAGGLAGMYASPQRWGDGGAAALGVAGAVLGVGFLIGAVVVCQRLWSVRLVVPLSWAIIGLWAALILASLSGSLGFSPIGIFASGAVVGFAVGVRRQESEPLRPVRKSETVDWDYEGTRGFN